MRVTSNVVFLLDVDDKLRILAAVKRLLQKRLTTVFPRQGHYAFDAVEIANYPTADFTVERIGDLVDLDVAKLSEER